MLSESIREIMTFIEAIKKKYNFNTKSLVNKQYTINNQNAQKCNSSLCHAKITLDGKSRQCSRKKKFGKLCGLHSKKINQKMYTSNHENNIVISPFKELLYQNNDRQNKQINSFINNLFRNTQEYNNDKNWSITSINNRSYRYNCITNQILTENGVEDLDTIQ